MHNLKSIIIGLQAEINFLKSEIDLLRSENRSLRKENESLRNENARLKDRLGLTSKTCSIPSSKELYKLKREKVKSLRNIGGQPGHTGTTRSKMIADEVIVCCS